MTVTVYAHEVISGSDIGMHFFMTLTLATAAAAEYHEAFRMMDPLSEPLGKLSIYEFILTTPEITTLIYILNSPQSVFSMCLSRERIVGFASG